MRQLLDSQDGQSPLAVDLYCYSGALVPGAHLAGAGRRRRHHLWRELARTFRQLREMYSDRMQWCRNPS